MPRCDNCGRLNKEGAGFCQDCGTRLEPSASVASGAAPVAVAGDHRCAACGSLNPSSMAYCRACGGRLGAPAAPQTCRQCGRPNAAGFAFCQHCGQPIAAAASGTVRVPATPPSGSPVSVSPSGKGVGFPATAPPPSGPVPVAAPVTSPTPVRGVPVAAIPVAAHGALQTNSGYPGVDGLPGEVAGTGPVVKTPAATGIPAGLTSVNRDGGDGRYYPITGDRFDVGRTSGMLLFGDDGYLSDRHVRIEWRDGAWVLVDLGSLNGTFLRIRNREEVQDGDTLLVGMQVLKFEMLPTEERDPAPAVEHGVLYFGTPPRRPWGRLRQVTTAGICRDVLHLYRPEVVIGRESGDIVFSDDEFMSRAHTALRNDAGRAYLVDLNSSNGTYLRIRKERRLAPGDFLRMGDQLLRFTVRS